MSTWVTQPLGEILEPGRGISYGIVQPGEAREDGVPIVRVNAVKGGRVDTAAPLRVAPEVEAQYVRTRLRGGELLLTLVGTVGEAAEVPPSLSGWNVARAVGVVPVREEIGARWVRYVLGTDQVRNLIDAWCNTTVQKTLNLKDVARIPITLPPENVRQAIMAVVGALDDKIDLNRRMNETLETMARALFRSWFVDFDPVRAKAEGRKPGGMDAVTTGLFPSGFEKSDVGEIPSGWRVTGIYDLATVTYGAPFASALFNGDGVGLPLLRIRDLATHDPEVFTPERHRAGATVVPGDIVAGMDGEFRVHAWRGPVSSLNQRVCMFTPRQDVPGTFLRLSLEKPLAFFERAKVGTTVIHLGKADIDTFRIVMPSEPILATFAALTDNWARLTQSSWDQSRTLAALRGVLLPKLLSGELRVREVEAAVGRAVRV